MQAGRRRSGIASGDDDPGLISSTTGIFISLSGGLLDDVEFDFRNARADHSEPLGSGI